MVRGYGGIFYVEEVVKGGKVAISTFPPFKVLFAPKRKRYHNFSILKDITFYLE